MSKGLEEPRIDSRPVFLRQAEHRGPENRYLWQTRPVSRHHFERVLPHAGNVATGLLVDPGGMEIKVDPTSGLVYFDSELRDCPDHNIYPVTRIPSGRTLLEAKHAARAQVLGILGRPVAPLGQRITLSQTDVISSASIAQATDWQTATSVRAVAPLKWPFGAALNGEILDDIRTPNVPGTVVFSSSLVPNGDGSALRLGVNLDSRRLLVGGENVIMFSLTDPTLRDAVDAEVAGHAQPGQLEKVLDALAGVLQNNGTNGLSKLMWSDPQSIPGLIPGDYVPLQGLVPTRQVEATETTPAVYKSTDAWTI